ncbi:unnamed protein product [Chrysoparadoxa australica]
MSFAAVRGGIDKVVERQEVTARCHKTKLDALSSSLQLSLQRLNQGQGQDPSQLAEAMGSLAKDVEGLGTLSSVAAEHKAFHAVISKLCKAVDKHVCQDLSKLQMAGSLDLAALNSLMLSKLYRQGSFEAAEAFTTETGASLSPKRAAALKEMHQVQRALDEGNLSPAENWVEERREALSRIGSTLCLQLMRLRFISLLKKEGRSGRADALTFAQRVFPKYIDKHMAQIQELMGCMAWAGRLGASPYTHLLSTDHWKAASEGIMNDGCKLLEMPAKSHLELGVQCGVAAAPTMLRMAQAMSGAGRSWKDTTELMAHVQLPPEMKFHTIFSCPVSGEQATAANPPVLLPCGHVVCSQSQARISKCPTCPTDLGSGDAMVLHIGEQG